jgi:hypothetical protein
MDAILARPPGAVVAVAQKYSVFFQPRGQRIERARQLVFFKQLQHAPFDNHIEWARTHAPIQDVAYYELHYASIAPWARAHIYFNVLGGELPRLRDMSRERRAIQSGCMKTSFGEGSRFLRDAIAGTEKCLQAMLAHHRSQIGAVVEHVEQWRS